MVFFFAVENFGCKYQLFMFSTKSLTISFGCKHTVRSFHKGLMVAGNIPKRYFYAEKDFKLKAQMGKKKNMSENVPGSNGHSFSLANSAGVFPVSTQLELRSIIGILQENQLQFHLRLRQKNISSQIQNKNHAEKSGDTHLR